MIVSELFQKLRDSVKGVSIFFEKSVLAVKAGGKREVIIEMKKNDEVNLYTLCYNCSPNERLLELRDELICLLSDLGFVINYNAPLYDYLIKMWVRRSNQAVFRSESILTLILDDGTSHSKIPISFDKDDFVYIIPRNRGDLESLISVVRNEKVSE